MTGAAWERVSGSRGLGACGVSSCSTAEASSGRAGPTMGTNVHLDTGIAGAEMQERGDPHQPSAGARAASRPWNALASRVSVSAASRSPKSRRAMSP
jgi:hypothetical protein